MPTRQRSKNSGWLYLTQSSAHVLQLVAIEQREAHVRQPPGCNAERTCGRLTELLLVVKFPT
jgi:hypothetical protein